MSLLLSYLFYWRHEIAYTTFLGGFFPLSLSPSLYYDGNRIGRPKAVTSIPISYCTKHSYKKHNRYEYNIYGLYLSPQGSFVQLPENSSPENYNISKIRFKNWWGFVIQEENSFLLYSSVHEKSLFCPLLQVLGITAGPILNILCMTRMWHFQGI